MSEIIVQKFGGTSVGSVERIDAVAEIIKNASKTNSLVVVVSAMGGETNKLIELSKYFGEDPDKREFDALVSTGETVSSALLAMALNSKGIKAKSYSASQISMKTTDSYSKAKILDVNADKILEVVQNNKLELDYISYNTSCKSSADGQIDLFVNGGVGTYTVSNNSIELSNDVLSTLSIENHPINTYDISITDSYNCKLDTAITVGFDGGYNCINEPTIITPNNDDFNDVWVPIVDLDTDIEVIIMNRWGQKEFYYSGNSLPFRWNGQANWGGQRDLPSSDYYYIIKFTNDNYSDRTGVITLIR